MLTNLKNIIEDSIFKPIALQEILDKFFEETALAQFSNEKQLSNKEILACGEHSSFNWFLGLEPETQSLIRKK